MSEKMPWRKRMIDGILEKRRRSIKCKSPSIAYKMGYNKAYKEALEKVREVYNKMKEGRH